MKHKQTPTKPVIDTYRELLSKLIPIQNAVRGLKEIYDLDFQCIDDPPEDNNAESPAPKPPKRKRRQKSEVPAPPKLGDIIQDFIRSHAQEFVGWWSASQAVKVLDAHGVVKLESRPYYVTNLSHQKLVKKGVLVTRGSDSEVPGKSVPLYAWAESQPRTQDPATGVLLSPSELHH